MAEKLNITHIQLYELLKSHVDFELPALVDTSFIEYQDPQQYRLKFNLSTDRCIAVSFIDHGFKVCLSINVFNAVSELVSHKHIFLTEKEIKSFSIATPVNRKKIKDLEIGCYFTLKEIENPKGSQIFIRGEYDRASKSFSCEKFSDINAERFFRSDKEVFTDFTF